MTGVVQAHPARGPGGDPPPSYLDHARDGHGSWPYYLVGLLLVLLAWLYAGGLLSVLLAFLVSPGTTVASLDSIGGAAGLAVSLVAFVPFLLATPLVVRYVLGRPWRTVVTGASQIAWGRAAVGAAAWFALVAVGSAIDWLLHRDDYRFSFEPSRFLPFLLVALLLIPVQTSAEEVFFRGYLMQWERLATSNRWLLAGINGLLFAVPHLANPEARGAWWYAWLVWFVYGAGWAWVSARDGGIELAVGAHAANNIFGVLVVGYDAGALPVGSVWTTSTLDLPLTIAAAVVVQVLFVLLTRPRASRRPRGRPSPGTDAARAE